ncbi:MAG: hypothetical protein PHS46_07835 [Candidatus Omnitrophica bacterium]|nr:hypothetical protein [Candidatus Omnitrophota bacterium]
MKKSKSEIINDSIWMQANIDEHIAQQMSKAMDDNMERFGEVVRAELKKVLDCNRKQQILNEKNVE